MGGNFGKNVVIAVSLLAAGFLAAWLRFRPYLGTEGTFTDGQRTIALESIDELRYAIWESPALFPGEINSDENERSPTLSPDGRFVVFVVGERGLGTDLWVAEVDSAGRAAAPRPLTEVNSAADELAPSFTASGALLFASNRAGGRGGLDLWSAPYTRGVFGGASLLPGDINTAADESDPSEVPGTAEVVFASNREVEDPAGGAPRRGRRDFDLYHARPLPVGEDGEPAWAVDPIRELNTAFDERDPGFTPDGRALLFASDRAGRGDFDLFRATRAPKDLARTGGPAPQWLDPRPLEGVNSSANERDPRPTADGFALYFARGDVIEGTSDLTWDVWRAKSRELVRTPGRPVGWRELLVLTLLLVLALLAALAKRWRGLDVIYKAFLISLLVHLGILLWSRDIVPTSDPVDLPGGEETRVRVRLVEDPESLRALQNQERGGRVASPRSVVEAAASPELDPALETEAREVESKPTAEAELERREAELAAAPEAQATLEASRSETQPAETRETLRTSEVVVERKVGAAPSLEVAASEAARAEAARRAEAAEADVDAAALQRRAALPEVASTAAEALARGERSAEPADAPTRRDVAVDRSADAASAAASAVDVAAPAPEFERRVADARRAVEVETAAVAGLAPARAEVPQSAVGDASALAGATDARPTPTLAPGSTTLERARRAVEPPTGAAAPSLADLGPALARSEPGAARAADLRAPTGEDVERSTAAAPTFDALAGAAAGAAPERASRGDVAGPEPAPAGALARGPATEPKAELAPSAARAAPLERARRGDVAPAPAFGPAFAGAALPSTPERAPTGPARPSLDLAAPEAPTPAVRGASDVAAAAPADLAPTNLADPLERRRAQPVTEAPGRLAAVPGPRDERVVGAPRPERFDVPLPLPPTPVVTAPGPLSRQGDWERTPYQSRTGERKVAALREYGGTAETEAAVQSGLAYLASRQRSDGRWGRKEFDREKYGQPMIGKTGLAVLAFMGAGHTPTSNTEYSEIVHKGLQFLVANQDPRTGHIGATNAYSHAIAAYALGEAYALTKADWLRAPLTKATAHIVETQTASADPALHGGWTYYFGDLFQPPRGTVDERWPRASVTAWQVMALESARLGGIQVPDITFKRARSFLVNCWDATLGAFRYSHDPSRLKSEYPLLPGSTPASMFALSLLGADLGEAQFAPARNFVLQRAPKGYRFTSEDDFVFEAQANLYFWYYGTLAMFRVGGEEWRRWNTAMKETLLPAQEANGSWRNISIYAAYAQDSDDDRVYTTAMNVLALEVYYRYFTPLLKVE